MSKRQDIEARYEANLKRQYAKAPAAQDEREALRDDIGQAIADKLTEWSEGGDVSFDPFDSRNIDEIADAVVDALAARAPQAAPAAASDELVGAARVALSTLQNLDTQSAKVASLALRSALASRAPQAAPVEAPKGNPELMRRGTGWPRQPVKSFAEQRAETQAAPAAQPTGGVTMSPTCACNRPSWWCVSHKCSDPYEAPAAQPLTGAARDVIAERQRQVSDEGWTPEHDDEHVNGGMAVAAACYAITSALDARTSGETIANLWPWTGWAWKWWKPKSRRHNLIRAGALILAEIERLDRAAPAPDAGEQR